MHKVTYTERINVYIMGCTTFMIISVVSERTRIALLADASVSA